MTPGSWLEISNYNPEKAAQIYSHGQVKTFILAEKPLLAAPNLPFIILIKDLDLIDRSIWKTSPNFVGFMLRTSTIEKNQVVKASQQLWIDYIVTDFKQSLRDLKLISSWPIAGYFISTEENFSARKLSQILKTDSIRASDRPHDLQNAEFNDWEDLETFQSPVFEKNQISHPLLSIIVPHFESPNFLCNVLKHLDAQVKDSPPFEVIVVDDGSNLKDFNTVAYFSSRHLTSLPLKILRWTEKPQLPSGYKIFRAGASRNWGASFAKAESIFFLDSDMLTPPGIVSEILSALEKFDVIQFVRKHIPHTLSSETVSFAEAKSSPALYVEESAYWSSLFNCQNWELLPDFWKYTCTYALALKKEKFFSVGRIRRNFIRYGFEDTDLGFRLHKSNCRFFLHKTELLHLTRKPDESQSFMFKYKKMNQIQPMAQTFYRLNLDSKIYDKFQFMLD